jgi:hypothetical protein
LPLLALSIFAATEIIAQAICAQPAGIIESRNSLNGFYKNIKNNLLAEFAKSRCFDLPFQT